MKVALLRRTCWSSCDKMCVRTVPLLLGHIIRWIKDKVHSWCWLCIMQALAYSTTVVRPCYCVLHQMLLNTVDVALSVYLCLCVGYINEPCINGWTTWDVVWERELQWFKEPCSRWGLDASMGRGTFQGHSLGMPCLSVVDVLNIILRSSATISIASCC